MLEERPNQIDPYTYPYEGVEIWEDWACVSDMDIISI